MNDFISASPVLFAFLMICTSVLAAVVLFLLGRRIGRMEGSRSAENMLKTERADAVKRSRAVLGGQLAEQVAPFLPGFPCNPADVRFIGKPVDFIGFPGAADGGEIQEVLLIEVKSGNSALSKREREIKQAVEEGRIRYVVYRESESSAG